MASGRWLLLQQGSSGSAPSRPAAPPPPSLAARLSGRAAKQRAPGAWLGGSITQSACYSRQLHAQPLSQAGSFARSRRDAAEIGLQQSESVGLEQNRASGDRPSRVWRRGSGEKHTHKLSTARIVHQLPVKRKPELASVRQLQLSGHGELVAARQANAAASQPPSRAFARSQFSTSFTVVPDLYISWASACRASGISRCVA